jgi:putative radical SAM enzyme (TIGR03279 family)
VVAVQKGGLSERLGLQPGDRLISINGHVLRDIIDCHFYGAEESLRIVVERAGRRFSHTVERAYGEELGLRFADDVFDGLRRCNNRCAFCFVDQMPGGMRRSLYVKDDDYRFCFLYGNFVTLSNWTEKDWQRIAEQRLSPLYVSVHATDLELRRRIFSNPELPDILAQLRRLGESGIEAHAQVVLVPGVNDGPWLERTVQDLADLYPSVRSVGVVPVGLTRHHAAGLRPLACEEERAIVEQITAWQGEFRRRFGVGLVYPSDELYLRGGFPIPQATEYDGFPQLENGIGLTRQLLDEWARASTRSGAGERGKGLLVCGTLIAPVLSGIVEEVSRVYGFDITLTPVVNDFFGSMVTVSGLLTGGDVLRALRGRELRSVVFLPRSMFGAAGRVTLDDLTLEEITSELGVPVVPVSYVGQILSYFALS